MNFTNEQNDIIYGIINKFKNDLDYKVMLLKKYNDNDFNDISIYDIYVIEEILREGNKSIIQKLISLNSNANNILQQVNDFLTAYEKDDGFRYYKNEQYKNNSNTLSEFESYLLENFLGFKKEENFKDKDESKKEKPEIFVYSEDDYDEMNPIDYSNDFIMEKTVENLVLGKFIHVLLKHPSMHDVAKRQNKNGQIHKDDKERVIKEVLRGFNDQIESQFKVKVKEIYAQFKLAKLFNKSSNIVDEYEKYNTNISVSEILARKNERYKR